MSLAEEISRSPGMFHSRAGVHGVQRRFPKSGKTLRSAETCQEPGACMGHADEDVCRARKNNDHRHSQKKKHQSQECHDKNRQISCGFSHLSWQFLWEGTALRFGHLTI